MRIKLAENFPFQKKSCRFFKKKKKKKLEKHNNFTKAILGEFIQCEYSEHLGKLRREKELPELTSNLLGGQLHLA